MSKPEQLGNELNKLIGSMSLFTRKTMNKWVDEITKDLHLTPERLMVMYELRLQPNVILKDLADSLMVSPASMSVMVQSLVELGLIERITNPKDRRRVLLNLTKEGDILFEKFDKIINRRFNDFVENLSIDDQNELNESVVSMQEVLDRILKHL